jgi:hypothetical protein
MGEVYRARDTRLDRTVAIKVLHRGFGSQPDARQRFEREARVISSLNHPHICTLHDIGQQDSVDFLVMEYLEGNTLQSRLREGALPLPQAVRYGIEIADALAEAHMRGILHRDVKPANIMLTRNGVKLLDFGLAKLRVSRQGNENAGSALATISVEQTEKGTILGTLQYMSPEQLEGKEVDQRTDIFALGLLLYEMATGRRAFAGASQAALIAAIMRGEFTPVDNVPPAFTHVLERCLATDPAGRWHAMADVKLELEWLDKAATTASPVPPEGSRRWLLAAVGAATFLSFLLGVAVTRARLRPGIQEAVYRFSIAPPPGAEFHRTPNHGGLAVSPDGRMLVFLAMRNGGTRLWLQPMDSAAARELPGTEEATDPFWSPDGRSLGFFAGGSLKRIDIDGSNLQVLCDIQAPRGGSWGPRNEILFAPLNSANSTIFRIPAAGGRTVSITAPAPFQDDSYQASPQFLPDGRRFLFWIGGRRAGTYIGSLDDPKLETQVLPVSAWAQFAGAGSAGPEYLFWHRDDTIVGQRWDSSSLRLLGEPVPLGGPVSILANNAQFSVSAAGLLVYQGPSALQMEWRDRAGKPMQTVGEPGFLQAPRQSPDGHKVAVVRQGVLTVTDIGRGVTSRIATGLSGQNVAWSPDSSRLAFARRGAIVKANASGGGEVALTPERGNELAGWTPDGRSVLYVDRTAGSGHTLWWFPSDRPARPNPCSIRLIPTCRPAFRRMDNGWPTPQMIAGVPRSTSRSSTCTHRINGRRFRPTAAISRSGGATARNCSTLRAMVRSRPQPSGSV